MYHKNLLTTLAGSLSASFGGLLAEAAPTPALGESGIWVGLAGLVVAVTGLIRVWREPSKLESSIKIASLESRVADLTRHLKAARRRLRCDSASRMDDGEPDADGPE